MKTGCARLRVAPATLNRISNRSAGAIKGAHTGACTLCAKHVRKLAGESPPYQPDGSDGQQSAGLPSTSTLISFTARH